MRRLLLILFALVPLLAAAATPTVTGTVTWVAPTADINGNPPNVTGYNIYVGTCGTTLTKVASVPATPLSYSAAGLQPSVTVCVAMTAVNSAGESAQSTPFSFAAPALPQAVSQPPSNVAVSVKQ